MKRWDVARILPIAVLLTCLHFSARAQITDAPASNGEGEAVVQSFSQTLQSVLTNGETQRLDELFLSSQDAALLVEQYKVARPRLTEEEAGFAQKTLLGQAQSAKDQFHRWMGGGAFSECRLVENNQANELNAQWYRLRYDVKLAGEQTSVQLVAVNIKGNLKIVGKP